MAKLSMEQIERLTEQGWKPADIIALQGGVQSTSKTVSPSIKGGRHVDVSSVSAIDAYCEKLGIKITVPFTTFSSTKRGYTALTSKDGNGYGKQAKLFVKTAGLTGAMDSERAVEALESIRQTVDDLQTALDLAVEVKAFFEAAATDLLGTK